MSQTVQVVVNGTSHELPLEPERSLLYVLREELELTGAKPGCVEGACGACTVLVDGEPVLACQAHLVDIGGKAVTTIEGLARNGSLHPVQEAFVEEGALQCGFCTAGMIMRSAALLASDRDPDDEAIREALAGNVCRCCTYPRIERAVRRAAELAGGPEAWPLPASVAPPSDELRPRRPWDLLPARERDYFPVLPEGLVVVYEPPETGAWNTSSGAWLHVGGDGRVTAFTGKVDVGQDNRTALTLRVAEELRVEPSAVRLAMGDTDVCPHDAGTFGSRSMPDAGEHLRRVAALARQHLVGLAAARWEAETGDLDASEGAVRSADGARTASYGELVRGLHAVEVATGEAPLRRGEDEQVAGRPARRVTAPEIVTGARRYTSDLRRPGMLHGRVLRAPARGSTLRSVDLSGVGAMAGAVVVHEGPFVGVAAEDPMRAGQALRAMRAEWDHQPQPSEAELVAHLRGHPLADTGWEGAVHEQHGDVDAALAAAPIRLSATYTTAYLAHVPLETHAALAEWGSDGHLTVWVGTQVPFGVRRELAAALEVLEEQVRVIVPDTGGGFGGKHAGATALEAARLARAAGRPVKVRWSRAEEFTAGYLRPAAVIDVRSGALPDGTLTAWEMCDLNAGSFGLAGPYEVANQRLVYQPTAAPFAQGSYRALAATANHFARESHMDELAHALGVDPLALRLARLADERLATVLRAAAGRLGWAPEVRGPGFGLGIACGVEKGGRVATAVEVQVDAERRVHLRRVVTAFECGAIVNPEGLTNQVEGATVMGLGGALFEAVHFADGAITNGSMTDYRVPRIGDVPPIEVVLIDRRDLPSAGGGETPILAIAPAVANAIFVATGVRLRSLPLVPKGIVP